MGEGLLLSTAHLTELNLNPVVEVFLAIRRGQPENSMIFTLRWKDQRQSILHRCFLTGSYRQLQTRLRANAESVAAYAGIKKEGHLIVGSFKKVVQHRGRLLKTQWLFSMWQVPQAAPQNLLHGHLSFLPKHALLLCQDLHCWLQNRFSLYWTSYIGLTPPNLHSAPLCKAIYLVWVISVVNGHGSVVSMQTFLLKSSHHLSLQAWH